MNKGIFYKDKPLFAIDIGFKSIKVMQAHRSGHHYAISGYGTAAYNSASVKEGVIIDHEDIARAIKTLFTDKLIGDITTRRVIFSIPANHTFNRILTLPRLNTNELKEAVHYEAEQYIPMPIKDLYLDFSTIQQTDKETSVIVAAAPKRVIHSYMDLGEVLNLDVIALETTISASGRLFGYSDQNKVPSVLIDFGSRASDITIYDKTMVVTGTVAGGGDNFTELIAQSLGVTHDEAHIIKTKYGLNVSKRQSEIQAAMKPLLDNTIREINRMIRFYNDRIQDTDQKIGQIVVFGGGANMPGLSEYLTNEMRLPVRTFDPWRELKLHHIPAPSTLEKPMYITAAGLAIVDPKEVFND